MNPQYIGYSGCVLLTFTFIPQTYTIIKKEKYDQINNLFSQNCFYLQISPYYRMNLQDNF